MSAEPSSDYLRSRLEYCGETGRLYWKEKPVKTRAEKTFNAQIAGKVAGSLTAKGYCYINLGRRGYMAHRLIWCMVHGHYPDGQIDHINGIRDDNRIENLRAVTPAENSRNRKMGRNNVSGVTGVHWAPEQLKWTVQICGRTIGRFRDKERAKAVAAEQYAALGFTERHGKSA